MAGLPFAISCPISGACMQRGQAVCSTVCQHLRCSVVLKDIFSFLFSLQHQAAVFPRYLSLANPPGLRLTNPLSEWWRQDLNLRSQGYEPSELPGYSTPRHCICYVDAGFQFLVHDFLKIFPKSQKVFVSHHLEGHRRFDQGSHSLRNNRVRVNTF